MAYQVRVLQSAEDDLRWMERHGQKAQATLVRRSLDRFLRVEPGLEKGARERMRPNTLGVQWALHLGALRVYYDIAEDANEVRVLHVGTKPGNVLFIQGQPIDLGEYKSLLEATMAETAKHALAAGKVWWGRLDETEEGRRLLANPRFVQLMEEARRSGRGLTLEESNRRAGITEEEWAAADAEIDRLLAEQAAAEAPKEATGAEATDCP